MGIENIVCGNIPLVSMESGTKWKGVLNHDNLREFFQYRFNSKQRRCRNGYPADARCVAADFSYQARQSAQGRPDEPGASAQAGGYTNLHFWPRRRISGGLVPSSVSSVGFTGRIGTEHSFTGFPFDGGNSRSVFGRSSRASLPVRNTPRTTRWLSIVRPAGNDVRLGRSRRKPHTWICLDSAEETTGKFIHFESVQRPNWCGTHQWRLGTTETLKFFSPGKPTRQSARLATGP